MKKKISLSGLFIFLVLAAQAQLDFSDMRFDIGANYTMYRGDFQQKTPGVKIRAGVPLGEKNLVGLGFTYGFPIKVPSSVSLSGGGSVNSEIIYNFKTISLNADHFFGGENEEGVSFYGSLGAGLVLVSYKENIKGTIPSGQSALNQIEKGSESGFTINGGLGLQYALGSAKIFGDGGIALPANQVNGQLVENVIPSHLTFNVGLRISIGGGSDRY